MCSGLDLRGKEQVFRLEVSMTYLSPVHKHIKACRQRRSRTMRGQAGQRDESLHASIYMTGIKCLECIQAHSGGEPWRRSIRLDLLMQVLNGICHLPNEL